jgi:hypothetical protein
VVGRDVYNPGGIPGLEKFKSRIPGVKKWVREGPGVKFLVAREQFEARGLRHGIIGSGWKICHYTALYVPISICMFIALAVLETL